MKEMILVGKNELKNNELSKAVETIRIELIKKDKSNFVIANQVTNIINGELWTDDFTDQNELATFLGISKSQVSLMKVVTEMKKVINSKKYKNADNKAIYNAFTMSRLFEVKPLFKLNLKDTELDIYDILDNFVTFVTDCGEDITTISNKDLRDLVSSYKDAFKGKKETEEAETEEAETTEEAEVVTDATMSDFAVDITIKNDTHHIENKDFLADLTKLMSKYDLI